MRGEGERACTYTSVDYDVSMLAALCRWERPFAQDEVSVGKVKSGSSS